MRHQQASKKRQRREERGRQKGQQMAQIDRPTDRQTDLGTDGCRRSWDGRQARGQVAPAEDVAGKSGGGVVVVEVVAVCVDGLVLDLRR